MHKAKMPPKTKPSDITTIKDLSIRVCMGTGGISAGSSDVMDEFRRELKKRKMAADIAKRCVGQTGCRGFCANDVLVDITRKGETSTYRYITTEKVSRIVTEHIIGGKPVSEWLVGPEYAAFHGSETKILLKQCGVIDPEKIDEYIETGGYTGLKKALSLSAGQVIEEVISSGLRGRGGAGFPTGVKWQTCSMSPVKTRYMICNADEGDPGAFMDRAVIEGNPHSVIEGMTIAGYAIGANEGFIYIRAEYPLAIERLRIAIAQAKKKGFLGKNIMKQDLSFDIKIKQGAGAFVCGEETALIASIEGKRGMPMPKPPFPAEEGLRGMPTVVNNVETLASVPVIISKGAKWYSSIGSEKSKGTKIFALTGKIKNTGLIEVPLGIPLRKIIYDIGGGCSGSRKFKAVQTGGPSGGCIPESHIDMPVDYESLREIGSMMGSGGMVVMDNTTCMVDMARFFLTFTGDESCGKCVPCRIGTKRLLEILTRITEGKGRKDDIEKLLELSEDIRQTSLCGLGQSAPNPVLSTIRFYRDEYEAHINEGRCPAGACEALRSYFVSPDKCKMCGKCFNACPMGAITWEKKKKARIDNSICIKCGSCYDACPFNAIL